MALNEEKIPIESFVYLYLLYIGEITSEKELPDSVLTKLLDLGFLTETRQLSDSGVRLLLSFWKDSDTVDIKASEEFEKFWKTFPVSDKWARFPETRKLRTNKKAVLLAYLDLLSAGISPDTLQEALETDIKNKKASPALDNPFRFMKGALNWLRDREFENVSFEKEIIIEDNGLL